MDDIIAVKGNVLTKKDKDFVFELDDFFMRARLDFTNETYFQNKALVGNRKYIVMPVCQNPFMDNEIRGYIQHMVMDKHHAPSYINHFWLATLDISNCNTYKSTIKQD